MSLYLTPTTRRVAVALAGLLVAMLLAVATSAARAASTTPQAESEAALATNWGKVAPAATAAAEEEYTSGKLGPNEWSCSSCRFGNLEGEWGEFYNSTTGKTTGICVGPVTYSGGAFHTPYGWACKGEFNQVAWVFSPIYAAGGIYNPNTVAIESFKLIDYWQ